MAVNSTLVLDMGALKTADLIQVLGMVSIFGTTITQLVKMCIDFSQKRAKNKAANQALALVMEHYSASNDALNDNVDQLTRTITQP
jgi:hypothetical protein